ncbi:hypothetical protein CDAR_51011 [Caerostris darwini]|uniref:Uncharacterized protein n=1 Tax=Caerostris darwini TaxID=1538125 RepID=A0AAV4U5W1_9ARAC|nr:hypothetical protein CDAR_51011 [Caerostris darwini]
MHFIVLCRWIPGYEEKGSCRKNLRRISESGVKKLQSPRVSNLNSIHLNLGKEGWVCLVTVVVTGMVQQVTRLRVALHFVLFLVKNAHQI